jgi:hypothetical protein
VAAAEARLAELKAQQAAVERSRVALGGGNKPASAPAVDAATAAAHALQRHQAQQTAARALEAVLAAAAAPAVR